MKCIIYSVQRIQCVVEISLPCGCLLEPTKAKSLVDVQCDFCCFASLLSFLLFYIVHVQVCLCSLLPVPYQNRGIFGWQCVRYYSRDTDKQSRLLTFFRFACRQKHKLQQRQRKTTPSHHLLLLWCLWWFVPPKQYPFMFICWICWKILYIAFSFYIHLFIYFIIRTSLSLHPFYPAFFSPIHLCLCLFTNNDEFYHTCTAEMANYIVFFPYYMIWSWCDVFFISFVWSVGLLAANNKTHIRAHYPVQNLKVDMQKNAHRKNIIHFVKKKWYMWEIRLRQMEWNM